MARNQTVRKQSWIPMRLTTCCFTSILDFKKVERNGVAYSDSICYILLTKDNETCMTEICIWRWCGHVCLHWKVQVTVVPLTTGG